MAKYSGKICQFKKGTVHCMVERAKPFCGKEKGADFHKAFSIRGKNKQKEVIWRKESKGTAKRVSQEGKKNITCVERIQGRGVKRDTLGRDGSEGKKKNALTND